MMISIIIPVFNAEKYVANCIDSILIQSFDDYELILVDDGSLDKSYSICEFYANTYDRVKVIRKENGGVSSARNVGLELASGKYITFIDSDDYIAPDYLENLFNSLSSNTEFVFSGLINCGCEDSSVVKLLDYSWDLSIENEFLSFIKQPLQSSPCAKLFLNSIINKYHLRFDMSLSYAEDKEFNMSYFRFVRNAISTSYSGYYYQRDVSNSLSKQHHEGVFKTECSLWELKREICNNRFFIGEQTYRYLSNDLFNLAYDRIIELFRSSFKPFQAISACKENMSLIDFRFLSKWNRLIKAPIWQKRLLINRMFFSLYVLNKLHYYGYPKG